MFCFQIELNYDVVSHIDRIKRPKLVTYWVGEMRKPWTEVTMSEEHQDFRWLGLEEACKLAKFDNLINALKECDQKLKE